jgi:hypothetical protein
MATTPQGGIIVRGKAIIVGGIGILTAAVVSVNAQNAAQGTTTASLASLVAARAQVETAEREVAIAVRSTASEPATKPVDESAEKADVDVKPATPRVTITAGCQSAINNLKTLHQQDVAEDSKERAGLQTESATALAAERSEDAAEAQQWKSALLAAHNACVAQPTTACKAAITSLQTQLQALHTEELGELHPISERDWLGDLASVRTAFSAVQSACPIRE